MTDVAETNFISKVAMPKKGPAKSKDELYVVKIKCLPYGFFEKQLWEFFAQFGTVVRARVARSTKTGKHKGWAYVGFDHKEVAEIAAETMNGYLMFEKRILCHVMAKVPKCMLKGPRYVAPPHMKGQAKKDAVIRNKKSSEEHIEKLKVKRNAALEKHAQKLKDMGVDYDLSTVPSLTTNNKATTVGKNEIAEPVEVISKIQTLAKAKTPKSKVRSTKRK